jgi:hypothetical protein
MSKYLITDINDGVKLHETKHQEMVAWLIEHVGEQVGPRYNHADYGSFTRGKNWRIEYRTQNVTHGDNYFHFYFTDVQVPDEDVAIQFKLTFGGSKILIIL